MFFNVLLKYNILIYKSLLQASPENSRNASPRYHDASMDDVSIFLFIQQIQFCIEIKTLYILERSLNTSDYLLILKLAQNVN